MKDGCFVLKGTVLGVDSSEQDPLEDEQCISRRRVVQNLESSRKHRHKTATLDAAFRKRFFALNVDDVGSGESTPVLGEQLHRTIFAQMPFFTGRKVTMNKGTIRALTRRRNSIFGTLDGKQRKNYAQQRQEHVEHENGANTSRLCFKLAIFSTCTRTTTS